MVNRSEVQSLLNRVNRDLERPVPIKTDAFGKKSIDQDTYQIGITLSEAQGTLTKILSEGLTD